MAGKREIVCILAAQGKKTKEIVAITGLNERTVNNYRSGINRTELSENVAKSKMTPFEQMEWTKAVNRIRKACGKEPFQIP